MCFWHNKFLHIYCNFSLLYCLLCGGCTHVESFGKLSVWFQSKLPFFHMPFLNPLSMRWLGATLGLKCWTLGWGILARVLNIPIQDYNQLLAILWLGNQCLSTIIVSYFGNIHFIIGNPGSFGNFTYYYSYYYSSCYCGKL